jgi:ATP synthase protein I
MNSVMFAAVGLQGLVVLGLAVVALGFSGMQAAWHLVLGGCVAIVPNALFALRLALHRGRQPESYPAVFFLGEFAKIGLTVGLLAILVRYVSDLQWLPMLIGLIAAVKAPLLLGFLRRGG